MFEYGLAGSLVWELYAVFGDDTDYECAAMALTMSKLGLCGRS